MAKPEWGVKRTCPTTGQRFYDMNKDPYEMNNLYLDPEYAEVIAKLKAELLRLREGLNETDEQYPHIQMIIEEHWDD